MRCPNRSGFTLIEIMTAILIIAVAVTSVLGVTVYSVNEAQEVIQEATAASTANAVMNTPTWPSTFTELNGYLVKREVDSTHTVPAASYGGATVAVDRITVTVRSRGKDVIQLVTYRHQ